MLVSTGVSFGANWGFEGTSAGTYRSIFQFRFVDSVEVFDLDPSGHLPHLLSGSQKLATRDAVPRFLVGHSVSFQENYSDCCNFQKSFTAVSTFAPLTGSR